MDTAAVVRMLRARQGEQSLRSLAADLGCHMSYLSLIYRGKREPGPKVLRALGLEATTTRITTYRRKGK